MHLCILLAVLAQILLFLSIYYPGKVPLQPEDIGMVSSIFYSNESKKQLFEYVDAAYLSDSHKARSQTGYVFNYNGTAISWRSFKQTMMTTSSNH